AAVPVSQGAELDLQMVFEKYFACGLGRFRISVTNDTRPVEASAVPHAIEEALLIPAEQRTPRDRELLLGHFVRIAPELAAENVAIKKLRDEMPRYTTSLVMAERPTNEVRTTYLHKRGEFLQPEDPVEPGIPRVLPQVPADAARNRLTFARWLVDRA